MKQFASWPVLPALVARLEAAVRTFRAADPFLPVHIVVPNHVLGTLLSRALFADTGYLAIHLELPHEFAWSISARECLSAGLLPVPEEVDLAIVLKAAAAAGRLRLIALIDESAVTQRILRHLGLPTEVPEARPARAPPLRDSDA